MATHRYELSLTWTGDRGTGTSGVRDFSRDVLARSEGRPDLALSADRPFRGDPGRWNPELLLLAAVAECHLLSLLHVATLRGVVVTGYTDSPTATLEQEGLGGRITGAALRPHVTVADPAHLDLLPGLHEEAAAACFVAASVAFPITHAPTASVAPPRTRGEADPRDGADAPPRGGGFGVVGDVRQDVRRIYPQR